MSKQESLVTKNQSAALQPKHVFGIRTTLQNCIQYFSQDKCAYIAGYYGVICKIKGNAQFFYPAMPEYKEITSFCVDESNDWIVFFMSQKLNDKIYFIFRYINKTYFTIEPGKTKTLFFQGDKLCVVASAMNLTGGVFCALIGPSTPSMVIIYSLESKYNPKLRLKAVLNPSFAYTNININRYDTEQFAIWGDGGFALLNLSKDTKPVEFTSSTPEFSKCSFNIVSSTWLSETCVAFLNDSCDIMIIDYSVHGRAHKILVKWNSIFDSPTKGVALFEKNTNWFVTTSDGFIIKCDKKNNKDKINFEKASSNLKPTKLPVMELLCLSASKVSETNQSFGVLMASADAQLYVLDLTNDNAISDGSNYKFLWCPFHSDNIISIDVAKWKQLVATTSKDKTVRVWNYVNLQLEAKETFEEEPLSVAFHPNGLHLAVLFKDRVRLMDILENTLKEFREIHVYQPQDIKFSSFGTMLSVCYKSWFRIYNFYTGEIIVESKIINQRHPDWASHKDELRSLTWDLDDTGFTTCGVDGWVIYWNWNNLTQPIVYQQKNTVFYRTEIMTTEDFVSKRIFTLSNTSLSEIYHSSGSKDGQDSSSNKVDNYDKDNMLIQSKVIQDGKYSSMIFDQELKLLITAAPDERTCAINIIDYAKYSSSITQKEVLAFQANSIGILSLKASSDMTHIFSGGKDSCLFFFSWVNVSKSSDKRDIEIHEPENWMWIPKDELDKNAEKLKNELNEKDRKIMIEEEEFQADFLKTNTEKEDHIRQLNGIVDEFSNDKENWEKEITAQKDYYENELNKIRDEHESKMGKLQQEHEENIKAKEDDKKTEEKIFNDEKIKDEKSRRDKKNKISENERWILESQSSVLNEWNEQIKNLQELQNKLKSESETDKKDWMNVNDKDIAEKRREWDKWKQYYEKTKQDHKELEEKLKAEIDKIRKDNKDIDSKRDKQTQEWEKVRRENQKWEKQIKDLQADKNEKEETINDKKELKRKLDKDNQELEKFKYVLHYKIKELKHSKEPKEKKIQQMEKKAKDMEREIKSCEWGQATIIIELSTNHQIIKIHEEQISKTEKRIEELRRYKKLFQESLYNSMKRARNHKDCKKELVLWKRSFLDKEKIDNVEKPFEANYELQREFLEKNVDHFKSKITKMNDWFTNDHNKVMKEKQQLVGIVNQWKKEEKEIDENENYKKNNIDSITKPKGKLKADVPRFAHKKKKEIEEEMTEEEKDKFEAQKLKEQLRPILKELRWYRYWIDVSEMRRKQEVKDKLKEEIKLKKQGGSDYY